MKVQKVNTVPTNKTHKNYHHHHFCISHINFHVHVPSYANIRDALSQQSNVKYLTI